MLLREAANSSLVRSRIKSRVRAFQTKVSPEAMYFWSRCPRALMVSNLFNSSARAAEEFAAAYEINQVPYPESFVHRFDPALPPPLTAAGWGYIMPQSNERLRWLFNWLVQHRQVVDENGRVATQRKASPRRMHLPEKASQIRRFAFSPSMPVLACAEMPRLQRLRRRIRIPAEVPSRGPASAARVIACARRCKWAKYPPSKLSVAV
jgi:hypothetical protein